MRKFVPNRPDKCGLPPLFTPRKPWEAEYTMVYIMLLQKCTDTLQKFLRRGVVDGIFRYRHVGPCKSNCNTGVAGSDVEAENRVLYRFLHAS